MANAEVIIEPGNRPYGQRDFAIKDADGNVLNFACDVRQGLSSHACEQNSLNVKRVMKHMPTVLYCIVAAWFLIVGLVDISFTEVDDLPG